MKNRKVLIGALIAIVIIALIAIVVLVSGGGDDDGDNGDGGGNGTNGGDAVETGADLAVKSISIEPESPQAGEAFALEIVVENVGGAQSGDYAVHIDFIDTGRSETLPVAVIERHGLDAGAEDIAFSSDIRRVENSGSFQVQVVIVPAGEDASPQNNTQRKAFIVQ